MAVLVPFNRKRTDMSLNGLDLFDNMLDDFFADGWLQRRSLNCDTFKVDVREQESDYLIEAELPGIKKDEINISIDENKLSISVTKEEKREEEKNNYLHRERRSCPMQRNIYLAEADSTGIRAKLDDGILTVTVPKKTNADKSVKIDIE